MTTKKDGTGKAGSSGTLSRRRFGQLAMMGLAGGALMQRDLLGAALPADAAGQAANQANLPARTQAEIEEKLKRIFTEYGTRLSSSQKERMRGIVMRHVRMLEVMRAIPLQNPDAPATVLKLVTRRPDPRPKSNRSAARARANKSARAGRGGRHGR